MIDRQHAAITGGRRRRARRGQAEPFHAVMMVATTIVIVRIGAVIFERGCSGKKRVAEGVKYADRIAHRH